MAYLNKTRFKPQCHFMLEATILACAKINPQHHTLSTLAFPSYWWFAEKM